MHLRNPFGWVAPLGLALLCGCAGYTSTMPDMPMFSEIGTTAASAVTRQLDPAAQGLPSWHALAPAIQRSLAYVSAKVQDDVAVAQGELVVTWKDVRATLTRLESLLPTLDRDPSVLAREFRWLRLTDGAHFSGYYEAECNASRTRSGAFRYPVYRRPADLRTARLGAFNPEWLGWRLVYRMGPENALLPYYTRAEIEAGALAGKGLELVWVKDPVDAYFLQVQGSGRIRLTDGTVTGIQYDGDNGRPYRSIGGIMADEGLLDSDDVNMQSIRAWLAAHPDRRDAILRRNERYVFFRLAPPGPTGALGSPLTPRVSLAVDRTSFPLGGVIAFRAPLPSGPLTGIGLAQDTGGAIKNLRLDLFCGNGQEAGETAGRINAQGEAWLLLAR